MGHQGYPKGSPGTKKRALGSTPSRTAPKSSLHQSSGHAPANSPHHRTFSSSTDLGLSLSLTSSASKTGDRYNRVLVAARIKPSEQESVLTVTPDNHIIVPPGKDELVDRDFGPFDFVFNQEAGQDEVFSSVGKDLVDDLIDGLNGCVMAYGQTGAGKTYTLCDMCVQDKSPNDVGLIPRAVSYLFEKIEADKTAEYELHVTYAQIYLKDMYDLLRTSDTPVKVDGCEMERGAKSKDLRGGFYCPVIHGYDHLIKMTILGQNRRTVGKTRMNSFSSRSHVILTIFLKRKGTTTTESKLMFVDLAGSERLDTTIDNAEVRRNEAGDINQSLLALGRVMKSLGSQSKVVPWREHKLTHYIQDVLGGNGRNTLIVNVHGIADHLSVTRSSLEFGQQSQAVAVIPEVNHVHGLGDDYRRIAAGLKKQLDVNSEKHRAELSALQKKVRTVLLRCQSLENDIMIERESHSSTNSDLTSIRGTCEALKEENAKLRQRLADAEKRRYGAEEMIQILETTAAKTKLRLDDVMECARANGVDLALLGSGEVDDAGGRSEPATPTITVTHDGMGMGASKRSSPLSIVRAGTRPDIIIDSPFPPINEGEVAQLTEELADAHTIIASRDKTIQENQDEMKRLTKELESSRAHCVEMVGQMDQTNNNVGVLTETVAVMQDQVAARTARVVALERAAKLFAIYRSYWSTLTDSVGRVVLSRTLHPLTGDDSDHLSTVANELRALIEAGAGDRYQSLENQAAVIGSSVSLLLAGIFTRDRVIQDINRKSALEVVHAARTGSEASAAPVRVPVFWSATVDLDRITNLIKTPLKPEALSDASTASLLERYEAAPLEVYPITVQSVAGDKVPPHITSLGLTQTDFDLLDEVESMRQVVEEKGTALKDARTNHDESLQQLAALSANLREESTRRTQLEEFAAQLEAATDEKISRQDEQVEYLRGQAVELEDRLGEAHRKMAELEADNARLAAEQGPAPDTGPARPDLVEQLIEVQDSVSRLLSENAKNPRPGRLDVIHDLLGKVRDVRNGMNDG